MLNKNNGGDMRRIRIFFQPFFVFAIGLTACNSEKKIEEINIEATNLDLVEVTSLQFSDAKMKVGALQRVVFSDIVKTNGRFDVPPENKVSLSAYFDGYVKKIQLIVGMKVTKGQELFSLENPNYITIQQSFLETKSKLKYLEANYERQKILEAEEVTSKKMFLKAEADYKVTLTQLEALKKQLEFMHINPAEVSLSNLKSTITVLSPSDGYITSVNANVGKFLKTTDVALTLVNVEHLHLELNIFEKDLPKIKQEQLIRFRIPNNPTKIYEAKVHLIGHIVNSSDRTVRVHGHLNASEENSFFIPGMFVEANIITTSDTSMALPKEAVISMEDNYFSLLQESNSSDNYSFKEVELKIGRLNDGYYEVLNSTDFDKNALFLTQGAFNLIQ